MNASPATNPGALDDLVAFVDARPPRRTHADIFTRAAGDAKFNRLWAGDTTGYPSASEADMALFAKLAFYTNSDATEMARLFRASALGQREKASREDYIERTVEAALALVANAPLQHRMRGTTGYDAKPEPEPPLELIWPEALYQQFPNLREPIIDGLLRRGEVMNIISSTKLGKSWFVMGLALSIATGVLWLGKIICKHGKVLIIDNELHPETFSSRLHYVAQSMGLDLAEYRDRLAVLSLRGRLRDLATLRDFFEHHAGEFDVIVLDAGYRFSAIDEDENSNASIARRYNLLDELATITGSAFVYVHHSTKGAQDEKSVTDVGAGGGAQSRACDTHLVLRPNAMLGPDSMVVEAAVRSWPPMEAFVIRRAHPLWVTDETSPVPQPVGTKGGVEITPEDFAHRFVDHLPRAKCDIVQRAISDKIPRRVADAAFARCITEGFIHAWKLKGQAHPKYANCPQPTPEGAADGTTPPP